MDPRSSRSGVVVLRLSRPAALRPRWDLCALPTGDHCARRLVCLGCSHAQPKQSAVPIFRRMLSSHGRALRRARESGEPAGQLAARELEIERIDGALRRANELSADAAAALEAVA